MSDTGSPEGMGVKDLAVLALAVATVAQAVFCISVLLVRAFREPNHLLLALFFTTICLASGGPVVWTFLAGQLDNFYALTLPAYLLMGPILWFYISWLTAEQPWSFRRNQIVHLIPATLGIVAVTIRISFDWDAVKPNSTGVESSFKFLYIAVGTLSHGLLFFWPIQSAYYVIRIFYRLAAYRSRLKNYFSSNEDKELVWFTGFMGVFAMVWVAVLGAILKQNVFGPGFMSHELSAGLFLVLVWSLGLWGLNQQPGFEGHYLDDEMLAVDDQPKAESDQKYQRSALREDQANRIASKIEAAMAKDHVYLDPMLSLHKLSRHILVSPNHISQTLNETIGESFFDYVNRWRITAAQPRILAGRETILTIAIDVGFNARSSFYKAFKRETGQTPSEYRNVQDAG
jgi:AraC-like DNA-binding protein